MSDVYDAIVVGARCAGSPTAMLLARKGYRVLLVDRATFPSDTISTHLIHPLGVAALARWGLLDRLVGDRLSADPHLRLRLRPVHHRRIAGHGGRAGRVLPTPHRPRQAARRRRGRSGRRGPRGLHGRGARCSRTAASSGSAVTRRAARRSTERAQRRGRRRRPALARRGGRAPEQYHEKPPLLAAVLHLLERAADGRPLRDLHPRRTAASRRRPRTTA